MKRTIAILMTLILLSQALPLSALASQANTITDSQLARAYALAGVDEGAAEYRKGMALSASMNARQLVGWLEEVLSGDLHSAGHMLARVSSALSDLESVDPNTWQQLARSDRGQTMSRHAQALQLEVEDLRQTLRLYEERLEENVTMISESGRLMQSDQVYDYEIARYSQRILKAQDAIEAIRTDMLERGTTWLEQIDEWNCIMNGSYSGDKEMSRALGEWISEVYLSRREPVTVQTRLTTSGSVTLRGRLSAEGSVLGDDDGRSTTVTVMDQNHVGFALYDANKKAVAGVTVSVRNNSEPKADPVSGTTDDSGFVIFEVNKFKVDSNNNMCLYVEFDTSNVKGQKLQSLCVPGLILAKGGKYAAYLKVDDGTPYIYKASFHDHDILSNKMSLLYSKSNDYDVEFRVTFKNTRSMPALCYADKDGKEMKAFGPTSESGGEYVFKNKWKSMLNPDQVDTIYFRLEDDPDKRYATMIEPIHTIFEKPTDIGGMLGGFGKGLGLSFKIPKPLDRSVNVSIGLSEWIPQFSVDPMGYVTLAVGNHIPEPDYGDGWKSNDAIDYDQFAATMANYVKAGELKAASGMWKRKMKQLRYALMAKGDMGIGVFVLLQARWGDQEDITELQLKGTVGGTLDYMVDLTQNFLFPVVEIPGYLDVQFGVAVSLAFTVELDLEYLNGKLDDWGFHFMEEWTLDIRLMLSVSLGVGFKGILDAWIKGSGYINFGFGFFTYRSPSVTITAGAGLYIGVKIILVTISAELISGNWTWYTTEKNSYSLLDTYMSPRVNEAASDDHGTQPQLAQAYPELVVEPTAVLKDLEGACGSPKLLTLGGDLYAFIPQNGRVHWHNVSKNISGSLEDVLKKAARYYDGNVPVAEMKDYALDAAVFRATGQNQYKESMHVDDYIALAVLCAKEFDDDNMPAAKANNIACYSLYLWRDGSTGALVFGMDGHDYNLSCYRAAWQGEDAVSAGVIADDPSILGASFNFREIRYKLGAHPYYVRATGQVNVGYSSVSKTDPDGKKVTDNIRLSCEGYTYRDQNHDNKPAMDAMTVTRDSEAHTDSQVACGAGEGYTRTLTRYIGQNTWVAVSASDQDSVIELYDTSMDAAGEGNRKSIVLARGNIDHIVTIAGSGVQTVFYVDDAEPSDDSNRLRLKSLRISQAKYQAASKGDLSFTVGRTTYDVDIGSRTFNVTKIGDVYYIYWLTSGHESSTGKGDAWRVTFAPWDEGTNAVLDDAVLAEVSLSEADLAVQELFLTAGGTGYFTAGPDKNTKVNSGEENAASLSLYSFPATMAPVMDLQTQVVEDLLVCPGDFDDINLTVMNSGNVAATALEVDIVDVKDKKEDVIGTLHADLLNPQNNWLKMGQDTVLTGEKAFYRLEDYDLTPRQLDFLAQETPVAYTVTGGVLTSENEQETRTNYYKTCAMMPGALAGFKGSMQIPTDWDGEHTIELRVRSVSTSANWVGAVASAAGRDSLYAGGDTADYDEIRYDTDSSTGKLTLTVQSGSDTASAAFAASAGTPEKVKVTTLHDLDVGERVYRGPNDEEMLAFTLLDHAETEETIHIYFEIYPDGAEEPILVYPQHYPEAVSDGATHTFEMPLTALLDPSAYERARVVVRGQGIEEITLVNNEFTLYLDGEVAPLTILRQPRDVIARPGETVSFSVEVTGGTAPYSYQWQVWNPKTRKWVDLEGYTTAEISRENIEKEWDGAKFRCVITDRAGNTVTSEEATLKVVENMPDTGDHSDLALYLAVAALALALMAWLRKRQAGRSEAR